MKKYSVLVPIVGYTEVEVMAENEEEAKNKALEKGCCFDDPNVDIIEMYGTDNVVKGMFVDHPQWSIEIEEIK